MASKMKAENSVAIHVRKGKDYVNEELFKGTCPVEYYTQGFGHGGELREGNLELHLHTKGGVRC